MHKVLHYRANSLGYYAIAYGCGFIVGLRFANEVMAMIYLGLVIFCVFLAFHNKYLQVLCLLPYLMYTEMFIRAFVVFIPYLFMQYALAFIFFILVVKSAVTARKHTTGYILFLFFVFIEFLNSYRSESPDTARFALINSLVLVFVILWASFNYLTPVQVNKILNHVKYASVYLCGYILVRYLLGNPVFQSANSGTEGTNGLAPVQLSGYLGFSCVIFFFSIMNDMERRQTIINTAFLCMCSIYMLLTFSRGGVYFLGSVMLAYFLFNSRKMKSWFLLLLLIPCALFVFNYVNSKTTGLIEDRYQQEGTSGRDKLVEAGWELFLREPFAGVGPGNFNNEIVKQDLYVVGSGAHNEFMRVAAEDGILGIFTFWGFFVVLFIQILRRKKAQREYAFYFLLLFCLMVVHNGLKVSLEPLVLLLAIATPSIIVKKKKAHADTPKKLALTS